jgi:peptidoglycan/xylan/chitin deacetylase (PgdA/CDA1 family)
VVLAISLSYDESTRHRPGALIVSLDLELHWGVRDSVPVHGRYRRNLLREWEIVPRLLALFREYEVAATWAVVGFLFALDRAELEAFSPAVRPGYADANLQPYDEPIGMNETDDPLHFAPSLVEAIRVTPRQEIATHTFSHYFCLEPGQNRRAFAADLESALRLAKQRGLQIQSIVFPRNQHNPAYDDLLIRAGIICYRGNARSWMHRASTAAGEKPWKRASRLLDSYVNLSGSQTVHWEELGNHYRRICNVPASFFLRPCSHTLKDFEALRFARISKSIRRAAAMTEVIHLWWHPHNFGIHQEQNLGVLRRLLDEFSRQREAYGMQSLSMGEAATLALGEMRK